MPGFHSILILRDEGDIIAQTLEHLLTWCDSIFVYDTGSLDDTWQIVRETAAGDSRVVPVAQEPVLFTNALRAWIFERYRDRFRQGDWIARVDADEFYHVPPPQFIRERLHPGEGRIYAQLYDFIMTLAEVADWQEGRETLASRAQPIEARRRWFRFDDYPELRLFRYRRTMHWPTDGYDPVNGGLVAVERIPVRHYRARDPVQMQVRCAIRAAVALAANDPDHHWHFADWRHLAFPEDRTGIFHWPMGKELPERVMRNHLVPQHARPETGKGFKFEGKVRRFAPVVPRAAQHVLYRSGLVHLRDRLRPAARKDFAPTPLPADVAARIERYLGAVEERPLFSETPLPIRERRRAQVEPKALLPA